MHNTSQSMEMVDIVHPKIDMFGFLMIHRITNKCAGNWIVTI